MVWAYFINLRLKLNTYNHFLSHIYCRLILLYPCCFYEYLLIIIEAFFLAHLNSLDLAL